MKSCSLEKEFNALLKKGKQYLRPDEPTIWQHFVAIATKKLERGNDDPHKVWQGTMAAIKQGEDVGSWLEKSKKTWAEF